MNNGTALTLGFGVLLVGSLLTASGLRNRSLSEVLAGKTSLLETEAAKAAAGVAEGAQAEATAETITGSTGGAHGTVGAQKEFGDALARISGLNRGVIERWLLSEQPPGSPSKPGSNNWLNVQYTDSGPNSTYYAIARLSPQGAARATWKWTQRQSGLRGIVHSAGRSPAEQERAIIESGWASSHYGGHL